MVGRRGEALPVGVAGELQIGGELIARCYLGRPGETAERFIPDDKSGERGGRVYKTGDKCRRGVGGELEYVGREDDQVKVRGYRIELGEIEAALSTHAMVKEAVVVAQEVREADKQLVAYVVGVGGEEVTASEMRSHLRGRLPEYMVPAGFVMLDEMPLNSNGKIDRKALPQFDLTREHEEAYIAPRNPIEVELAGIWTDVLNIDRAGIGDNFFELGGHLLLATQLVSRIRETFHVELPLRDFFEAPTIAELAEIIEASMGADQRVQAESIRRIPHDGELPLSFAQQRLWFLYMLEPSSAFYNTPIGVRLKGRLNISAFGQSLNEVVRRHEGSAHDLSGRQR